MLVDSKGVVYSGRTQGMNEYKQYFAVATSKRTLAEAMEARTFSRDSARRSREADMVKSMARDPIIFAMANPDPEIGYMEAKSARPDAIMATGRSDFPNQVNNVLGFPFIFRGALDVKASTINEAMKSPLRRRWRASRMSRKFRLTCWRAYGVSSLKFGPDYIIPKPMDPPRFNRRKHGCR